MNARQVALEALARIDDGAYANLAVRGELDHSRLDERDRHFVTDLVYGTTRMRRACDFLIDRYLLRPVTDDVRRVLRLGAYQLQFASVPPHAAVSETVTLAPQKVRGLVNAVLRRVASETSVEWPDEATRLSYPDWILERLSADLGREDALAALEQMNTPAEVTVRDDGYRQDRASQWVAAAVGASTGERVLDLCAAPGGKSTAMAKSGAVVTAMDLHPGRTALIVANGLSRVAVADGRHPPFAPATFDRVLVDAPCSGLGALRRRPDARWRSSPEAVERLAALQCELVDAAVALVRPGGTLVYSVCTLTATESLAVDEHLLARHPTLQPLPPLDPPWRPWGRGAIVLPQDAGTDGMTILRLASTDGG
ncbi:MAG TPA: transcription antitermination factor NusB [Acidimicrobiales bacterium]|nr:transcription antitermination factor NusB [Acidimicrobiales bacterium]